MSVICQGRYLKDLEETGEVSLERNKRHQYCQFRGNLVSRLWHLRPSSSSCVSGIPRAWHSPVPSKSSS